MVSGYTRSATFAASVAVGMLLGYAAKGVAKDCDDTATTGIGGAYVFHLVDVRSADPEFMDSDVAEEVFPYRLAAPIPRLVSGMRPFRLTPHFTSPEDFFMDVE